MYIKPRLDPVGVHREMNPQKASLYNEFLVDLSYDKPLRLRIKGQLFSVKAVCGLSY